MGEAYIVDAVRTPVGRRRGGLAGVHPADLGAHPIRALVERTGVAPAAIGDVMYGCCRRPAPTRRSSTPTAVPSPWATRWAPRVPG
jgi:acetyl-CoA acetyltransferase